MKKNVLLLFLLFVFFKANSNDFYLISDGSIKGKVKDKNTGESIEYATIGIYNSKDSSLIKGAATNSDGFFEISNIPNGNYYVEVSFVGYKKTRIKQITINDKNKSINLGEIGLEPSLNELNEVVVVGERPAVDYKIDKKVINVSQQVTAQGGTAVDVLENVPSVQVDIDGNVSLRGSTNFTVLIDGKPSLVQGNDILQQIPASAIETIEIITNPSAKYNPEGPAGIINIIMKKQKQVGINGIVNVRGNTTGRYGGDFLFNFRRSNVNFFVGGGLNRFGFDGVEHVNKETYINDTTYYQLINGDGKMFRNGQEIRGGLELYFNDKNILTLSANYRERSFGRDGLGKYHEFNMPETFNTYFLRNNLFNIKRNTIEANVDYQKKFNDNGHQIVALLQYSKDAGNEITKFSEFESNNLWQKISNSEYAEQSIEKGGESSYTIKIDYTYPFSEMGKLEAGYEGEIEASEEKYNYQKYLNESNLWYNIPERYNNTKFNHNTHAIYLTYSNTLKIFDYQLGLRTEYEDRTLKQIILGESYNYNAFNFFPSLHLSKKLPYNIQILASYSRRINRPRDWYLDPFENYIDKQNVRKGNPLLKPEFTNSYEFNIQKSFKNVGFASIEFFHRETKDVISNIYKLREDNVMIQTFENLNKSYATGLEAMLNIPLAKWFLLNTSTSLYNYRLELKKESGIENKESFTWNARYNLMFKINKDIMLQYMGFYRGPSITAQGREEGVFFSNIGLRKDFFNKQLTVTLRVRDFLGSSKWITKSEGEGFKTYEERQRQSNVIGLSISWKINNYKLKNNKQERDQTNEYNFDMNEGENMQ